MERSEDTHGEEEVAEQADVGDQTGDNAVESHHENHKEHERHNERDEAGLDSLLTE